MVRHNYKILNSKMEKVRADQTPYYAWINCTVVLKLNSAGFHHFSRILHLKAMFSARSLL